MLSSFLQIIEVDIAKHEEFIAQRAPKVACLVEEEPNEPFTTYVASELAMYQQRLLELRAQRDHFLTTPQSKVFIYSDICCDI